LIGAPQGATLAQIKQESGFNPNAVSQTGVLGLSQMSGVAIADILYGRMPKNAAERKRVEAERKSLIGNPDKALQYHRAYSLLLKKRHGGNWQARVQKYNGDVENFVGNKRADVDYIDKITSSLGTTSGSAVMAAAPKSTGEILSQATEDADNSKSNKQASLNVTPVNNSRTSINNQTQNHLPSMAASTPAEFAPHVA
jgi:hypothetical protein